MKKLVNETTTTEVTVSSFLRGTEYIENITFYYASGNKYPVFLKCSNGGNTWGFMSPLASNSLSYTADSAEECIKTAMKSRQVFSIKRDEWELLFKTIR